MVAVLALTVFLAPALGVPSEEMLQDTLKSTIVSFGVLVAALLFFVSLRSRREALRWHAVTWLPLLLLAYALGSMVWSHTYLGAVEAIRWFVFALLLWLGLNTLSRERLPTLAWGIHLGAVVASLWAALQFLVDFKYFPQGPHPASTFINRNFFAEFAVCTLPFGAMLLARSRASARVALLSASTGLVIVAILMTGTRAALMAMWLQLLVLFPFAAWLYRRQLPMGQWSISLRGLAAGVLLAVVAGIGVIPTGDPRMVEEARGNTALERGLKRTSSISPNDESLGVRMIMWKATAGMIAARPYSGVGAGAWENDLPLYQAEGTQLETDYYVHNEYLQLLAEYGLVGWLFLLALAAWLLDAARRTLLDRSSEARAEAPWRAVFLVGLLAFLVISNVGFAWRMAATDALFALFLGALAASDARLGIASRWSAARLPWPPQFTTAAIAATVGALALAAYIAQQAAAGEARIVRAARIALTISASPDPTSPRWNKLKAEMLQLTREGIAINSHYRKITPVIADEAARWGDWKNAIWIWESVLSSRPYIVAVLTNVTRGYMNQGETERAKAYLERAKRIQPNAPAVRSAEVLMLARAGQEARALELGRKAIADSVYDYDMLNTVFLLASRANEAALARKAMEIRLEGWEANRAQGLLQLGLLLAREFNEPARAMEAFQSALALTPEPERASLMQQLPADYRGKLAAPPQTSASKG